MKGILKIATICVTITTVGLMSCDKNEKVGNGHPPTSQDGIVGSWKLIEVLMDPGNGSGTFQPVTSNKVIQILSDSSFVANGQMCNVNSDTVGSASGFLVDSMSINLTPGSCWGDFPLGYEHTGNELIIKYNCIEACQQKYIKL